MLAVIVWKEWRQQAPFFVAIIVLAAIVLAVVALTMPAEWANRASDGSFRITLVVLLFALAVSQGVVSGSLLFAGETEDRTQEFLDQHAGLRTPIWRAKLIAGATLSLLAGAVLGGLLVALDLAGIAWLLACLWFALDGLVWSAAFSATRQTTFGAIGLSVLVIFGPSIAAFMLVLFNLNALLNALPNGILWNDWAATRYLAIKAPAFACALYLSWRWYCSTDRDRADFVSQPLSRHWPLAWFRVCLWQLWMRRRWTLAALAIAPFALTNLALVFEPLVIWPIGTFLIGSLAGWAVFADERAEGAMLFLGDQRLPRTRLWLAKALPLFLVALFGCYWALHMAQMRLTFKLGQPLHLAIHGNGRESETLYAYAFVIQGFAFAVFLTQQTRTLPVAVLLTLTVGGLVAAMWYPSLYFWMPPWRAWVIPIALLIASRLSLPRWSSGRLHDRRGLALLATLMIACGAWLMGNLWWRVHEYPDPGEPFDMRAYRAWLTESPNPNGSALRAAGGQFLASLKAARLEPNYHLSPPEILIEGYPDGPELTKQLDAAFQGDWVEPFMRAALAPPDRLPQNGKNEWDDELHGTVVAAKYFLLRALAKARAGESDLALANFEVALGAIRHGLQSGDRALRFLDLQHFALGAAALMLDEPIGTHAIFRDKLSKILARHDELLPSFAATVKEVMASSELLPRWLPHRFPQWLAIAPWEVARAQRFERRVAAKMIDDAERRQFPSYRDLLDDGADYVGSAPAGTDGIARGRLWNQFEDSPRVANLAYSQLLYSTGIELIRALRLALAVAEFESKTSHRPDSIEQLVGTVLPRPIDNPIIGRTFMLKTAEKESHRTHFGRPTPPGRLGIVDRERYNSFLAVVPTKSKTP